MLLKINLTSSDQTRNGLKYFFHIYNQTKTKKQNKTKQKQKKTFFLLRIKASLNFHVTISIKLS